MPFGHECLTPHAHEDKRNPRHDGHPFSHSERCRRIFDPEPVPPNRQRHRPQHIIGRHEIILHLTAPRQRYCTPRRSIDISSVNTAKPMIGSPRQLDLAASVLPTMFCAGPRRFCFITASPTTPNEVLQLAPNHSAFNQRLSPCQDSVYVQSISVNEAYRTAPSLVRQTSLPQLLTLRQMLP